MNFYSTVNGITKLQYVATVITVATMFAGFEWYWWIASIGAYFLTGCLGVTITFHRLLSHRSFSMPKSMEYIFSFLGAMGGTGSTIGWIAVHNAHHKHSDTDHDPHNPHIIGASMLLSKYRYIFNLRDAKSLIKDKFHMFLHRYYYIIMIIWAGLLCLINIKLFLFCFIVPAFLQIWASNISNYANHLVGYRNYNTSDNSQNTWWVSVITWGEGWHNNHHAEPWMYTFQRRWWEIDISGYVTYLICILTGNRASLYNSKY